MKNRSLYPFAIALGLVVAAFIYLNINPADPFEDIKNSSEETEEEDQIIWPNSDFSILMDMTPEGKLEDSALQKKALDMAESNEHYQLLAEYVVEKYPGRMDGDYEYMKMRIEDTPYYVVSTGFPTVHEIPESLPRAILIAHIPAEASSNKKALVFIEEYKPRDRTKPFEEKLTSGGPELIYVEDGGIERFSFLEANKK